MIIQTAKAELKFRWEFSFIFGNFNFMNEFYIRFWEKYLCEFNNKLNIDTNHILILVCLLKLPI